MSIEAMVWAMNLAPVPYDKTKPSAACAAVLIGLANHADPDGRAAFPAVDTLVRYTRLSRRTVITALDRLEEEQVITACDPDVIAAKIKRADRRPNGYDLAMDLYRDDLGADELTAIHRSNPMLRGAVETMLAALPGNEVQPLHLVGGTRGAAGDERGAVGAERGATTVERGAAAAPEPTKNPPGEPSKEPTRGAARQKPETTIPDEFHVTDEMKTWIASQDWFANITHPGVETQNFIDHAKARGSKYRDWAAAWRTWMRNAGTKYAQPRGAAPQPEVDAGHRDSVGSLW